MTPAQLQSFEAFWSTYPRRVGKGAARKAYEKAIKITTPEAIMAGLHRQLAYYATREQQFIPHPSTWLNQERWADDPQPSRPQPMQRRAGDMGGFAQEFLERLDAQQSGMDRRDNEGAYGALAYSPVARRH